MAARFGSLLVIVGILSSASVAWAQAEPVADDAALPELVQLDDLPPEVSMIVQTSDALLLLEPPARQQPGQPMVRLVSGRGMYSLDPVQFGNPNWSRLKINHVTQGSDGTLWAVGSDSVLVQPAGDFWQSIELPQLNSGRCKTWERFGSPCQMIVPVSEQQAVVFRPSPKNAKFGTEVVAVQAGELRALGTINLPGIALGPVVSDGQGGFWVMIRRTSQSSNFKPMRGYMRYTSGGTWQMWSDSGESVEGTEYIGKTKFLVDTDARKIAPDGRGGFFTVGADRVIYHVDQAGESKKFSADQPRCVYCQPIALSFDKSTDQLTLLLGEYRVGEAGQFESKEGPVRLVHFDAKSGALVADPAPNVPIPAEYEKKWMGEFLSKVQLASTAQGTWVAAPGLYLHQDGGKWFWPVKQEVFAKQLQVLEVERKKQQADPKKASLGTYGSYGLIAAGLGGGYLLGTLRSRGDGRGLVGYRVLFTSGFGALAGWLPALMSMPFISDSARDLPSRRACLGAGAGTMIAVTGLSVWLAGSWLATTEFEDTSGSSSGSMTSQRTIGLDPMGAVGAIGGAALGSAAGMYLMKLIYDYGDKEPDPQISGFVVSAVASSVATLLFVATSRQWKPL